MPFQAWIYDALSVIRLATGELQWGHALSGMDMLVVSESSEAGRRASMGPCPFRHGYTALFFSPATVRDCFNGAMPFQAWI